MFVMWSAEVQLLEKLLVGILKLMICEFMAGGAELLEKECKGDSNGLKNAGI